MENQLKYNKYSDTVFRNGGLSELMISKEGAKRIKSVWKDQNVYNLLNHTLLLYGIHIDGGTYLLNLDGSQSDVELKHVSIDVDNIPLENLELIWELYRWEDSKVDIGLYASDSYTLSAILNTKDRSATLVKWEWCNMTVLKNFNSIEDLVTYYRHNI